MGVGQIGGAPLAGAFTPATFPTGFSYRWQPRGAMVDEIVVWKNTATFNGAAPRTDDAANMLLRGAVAPVNPSSTLTNNYGPFLSAAIDNGTAMANYQVNWPAYRVNVGNAAPASATSRDNYTRVQNSLLCLNPDGTNPTSVRVRMMAQLDLNPFGASGSYRASRLFVGNTPNMPIPPTNSGTSYACMAEIITTNTLSTVTADMYVGNTQIATLYAASGTGRDGIYVLDATFTATAVNATFSQVGGSSVSGSASTTAYAPGVGLRTLVLGAQCSFATAAGNTGGQLVGSTGLGPFDIAFV